MEQRSPEWYAARLGKVTASRVADLMATTKTGYGAGRANYMAELICERLTGLQAERYTSVEMQWGTDMEPQARAAYSFLHDTSVVECGFIDHKTVANFGASPDGLIGDAGLIEIKCPNTATHIEFLLSKTIPGKYLTQMQAQLACTARAWCDFVSFDPRLPEPMQMWVCRVQRDGPKIMAMESEIATFLSEMNGKLASLKTEYGTTT